MKFQSGVSGNPNGRPAGTRNKRTELVKLLEPHAPALINKCVELALAGNEACLRLAIDKLLPRAKDQAIANIILPTERISPDSILEIGDSIWRQLEKGEITLEQAKYYFAVMKVYRDITPEHSPATLIDSFHQYIENKRLELDEQKKNSR